MNAPDQVLFDKIKQLPPRRLAEVEALRKVVGDVIG